MKRIARSIALFLAAFLIALVVVPRTALAIDHPILHEIYVIGSDGQNHYLDSETIKGLSYDEEAGILYMEGYNGGPIAFDTPNENKCQATIMLSGTNTISTDGSYDSCIEFLGGNNSLVIRSEKGGTLNLNITINDGLIVQGMFVGGGVTIGGSANVNINLENKSSKGAVLYGVLVSDGTFLVRDTADLTIKLKGKCIDANGVNLLVAKNRSFKVTTSGYVTVDCTGVTGCATYGVQAQQCTKPFIFAGCPSVMFRTTYPWTDGYYGSCPDVDEYLLTSTSTSHEYTPNTYVVPVFRMYNTKTSEHLYTPRKAEYDACGYGSYVDWRQEEVGWWAPKKTTPGANPVYRLYNTKSGDHHYTTSAGEKAILIANYGWVDEGVAFYSGGVHSVHRLYNGSLTRGQHHYTTSAGERDSLVKNYGWKSEGIGFYCI